MLTWTRLQQEVGRWVEKNFPGAPIDWQVWGLIEELGELVQTHLKRHQKIRGSEEQHIAAGKDAVGDSLIFFMHACTTLQWDAEKVLRSTSAVDFQATFGVPPDRTPIVYMLRGLTGLAVRLEDRTHTMQAIYRDAYEANAKEASLEFVAGLSAYCTSMGWSMQQILEEVWPIVRARDWTKNKVDGAALVDLAVVNLEGVTKTGLSSKDAPPEKK
jgi:hypothetical protein